MNGVWPLLEMIRIKARKRVVASKNFILEERELMDLVRSLLMQIF